jgi:hypothetical protein
MISKAVERRTWNTPVREKWNEVIRCCLKGVDNHNEMYFQTLDGWHLAKAEELRKYVIELKTKIIEDESDAGSSW